MNLLEQMSSKWSFTCTCGIFCPKPFHDHSLYSVCILHPAWVLLSVCSLHFTLSLHFTPGPQSAVCSPQSAFYTDRSQNPKQNHKTQNRITKPKIESQNPKPQNRITKLKTPKQNHKTQNRITKLKTETQNSKQNHKVKKAHKGQSIDAPSSPTKIPGWYRNSKGVGVNALQQFLLNFLN